MKTSKLIGPALDWAVAKAEGLPVHATDWNNRFIDAYNYSTDWAKGGPIIEREKLKLRPGDSSDGDAWVAATTYGEWGCVGPTPLVAAMRTFVASKLGSEVEIPNELTN